jgi:glycosyltransferase involved in cell wall biosynthesis
MLYDKEKAIYINSIIFITKGDIGVGSSKYRAFQIGRYFHNNGWNIFWGYRCQLKNNYSYFIFFKDYLKSLLLILKKSVKIIYFQRADVLRKETLFFFIVGKIFKLKLIYDIDDYIDYKNNKISYILTKYSDVVIVASHALYNLIYEINKRVYLLNTPYDEQIYIITKRKLYNKNSFVVGFLGDGFAYKNGLIDVFQSLSLIPCSYKRKIKFIYCGNNIYEINNLLKLYLYNIEYLIIDKINWNEDNDIFKIINNWDFGVVPKRNTNDGGFFKTIQYFASNVIPIAYNIGENRYYIDNNKNGFLINDNEWGEIIQYAIDHKTHMYKINKKMNEDKQFYTLSQYCQNLSNILSGNRIK